MDLHKGVLNVLSCKYVDEVIIGSPWVITHDLIKTLHINIVCSGRNCKFSDDMSLRSDNQVDLYCIPKQVGVFHIVDSTKLLSTNDVVDRMVENRKTYENRNTKRSAKETTYLQNKEYVGEL